jgi:hypothetical protein
MNDVSEADRASASAMVMFCNSLVTAGATSMTGILIACCNYLPVVVGIAGLEAALALLFRFLMQDRSAIVAAPGQICAESLTD